PRPPVPPGRHRPPAGASPARTLAPPFSTPSPSSPSPSPSSEPVIATVRTLHETATGADHWFVHHWTATEPFWQGRWGRK
ncbi:MAG: hypothetical protein EOO72_02735, partial [Myxococcaceae bacterium]